MTGSAEERLKQSRLIAGMLRRLVEGPVDTGAPMSPGDPIFGHMHRFRDRPLEFLLSLQREHGDIARIDLAGLVAHGVFHPDGVQHVLQRNARNYTKNTPAYRAMRLALGNGLITSDGPFWLRQRRIAQPAFQRQRIDAYIPRMERAARHIAEKWRADAACGREIDVFVDMMHLTVEVVGDTMFGADVSDHADALAPALAMILADIDRRITHIVPVPLAVPTPSNVRLRRAIAIFDRVILGIIAERRRTGVRRDDLLDRLMYTPEPESGEVMTDAQLRDEAMTMFAAGHETTANALTWTWWLLSLHPGEARRLHEELDVQVTDAPIDVDTVKALGATQRVVLESMRLYPPAWIVARAATHDDEVLGVHVPAGSIVFASQWVTHRHPGHWAHPEGFDPDRFRPDRSAGRHRYAYFPFAGGPRQCIGNHFAMVEATVVLARLARAFQGDVVPGHRVELEPVITLRPRHGVRATIRRRVS